MNAHTEPLRTLYLGSLGGKGAVMAPAMDLALAANFGSAARWHADFAATAQAPGRAAGWALLVFQPTDGRLVNQWHPEPVPAPPDGVALLALDLRTRPGTGAAAADTTVDACMQDILWSAVYERYQHAVHEASTDFGIAPQDAGAALLLDVRREGVYRAAPSCIAQAVWRDPASVAIWAADLPTDQPIVVYCVYGHEVGRSTAMRLRAAGLNARYMQGGLQGWEAAGLPVQAKPQA